jgi:hypothetical protein
MDGRTGALVRAQIENARLVPMRRMLDSGFREFTSARAERKKALAAAMSRCSIEQVFVPVAGAI